MGCAASTDEADTPRNNSSPTTVRRGDEPDTQRQHGGTTSVRSGEVPTLRGSVSGRSDSSSVPPLFGAAATDKNLLSSMSQHGALKDAVNTFASLGEHAALFPKVGHPDDGDLLDAPAEVPAAVVEAAAQRLLAISDHRVTNSKMFKSTRFFTSVDESYVTLSIERGHQPTKLIAAVDPDSRAIENIVRCLEAVVRGPAAAVVSKYTGKESVRGHADDDSDPPTFTCDEVKETCSEVFKGSFWARYRSEADGMFRVAVTNAIKLVVLSVGGSAGLVGCMGSTGVPWLPALDRLFQTFLRTQAPQDHVDVGLTQPATEFFDVLRWLGLLPKAVEATDVPGAPYQTVKVATVYQQLPHMLMSPAAKRIALRLEFAVFRRNEYLEATASMDSLRSVRIPRIGRKACLSDPIADLVAAAVIPETVHDFFAPVSHEDRGMPLDRTFHDFALTSGQGHLTGADDTGSPAMSPDVTSPDAMQLRRRRNPSASYFHRASLLLRSKEGRRINLKDAFGRVRNVNSHDNSIATLRLSAPHLTCAEGLIRQGELITYCGQDYRVLVVTRERIDNASFEHDDELPGAAPRNDDVLSPLYDAELLVVMQRVDDCGLGNNDLTAAAMAPSDTEEDVQEAEGDVMLFKSSTPCFVRTNSGHWLFNQALPTTIVDHSVDVAPTVTQQVNAANLRLHDSESQTDNISRAPAVLDSVVECLQQFYYLGWLIASAIVTGNRISTPVPLLLFRILKSYRPKAPLVLPSPSSGNERSLTDPGLVSRQDTAAASACSTPSANHVNTETSTTSPTADRPLAANAGQTKRLAQQHTCHFQPTLEDLVELGGRKLQPVEAVRCMSSKEFETMCRAHSVETMTKEEYISTYIVAPHVAPAHIRSFVDAAFIALADTGIVLSPIWQYSSPEELQHMVSGA